MKVVDSRIMWHFFIVLVCDNANDKSRFPAFNCQKSEIVSLMFAANPTKIGGRGQEA